MDGRTDLHEHNDKKDASPIRKNSVRKLRIAAVLGVLAVYAAGMALHTGLGSPSAFGVGDVSLVCPLGALETALAGGVVLPLPVIALTVAAVLCAVFGRAFCGWACPVPLARKLITNKEERDHRQKGRRSASGAKAPKGWATSTGVLVAVLATTLVFGFPVFCLVCPVGLVFASVFAVIRLIAYNELVVDLLVFPALIVLELVLLKKWCSALCPIGALLGLFSRLNKTFVPTVDRSKCLAEAKGSSCDACNRACNSDIDLIRNDGIGSPFDCTKCGECAAHCPADAISFPLLARNDAERGDEAKR